MNVIIIGGGASGLVAAIMARRKGANVTILERNKSCGKKLLVTGNGKCNYYNDNQDIKHYHSTNQELINKIINKDTNKLVLDFFDSIGIIPNIKNGYYYPYSNQAITIVNALVDEAKYLGIDIITDIFVETIEKKNNKFILKCNIGNYKSDKLILATGSSSYYRNMDINSYLLAKKLGHKIIKPLPALVQLKSNNKICKKWTGVRSNVSVKLYQGNNYIREEEGEIQLTNYGVSGICAMQLSNDIARYLDKSLDSKIIINFVPDIATTNKELIEFIDNYNKKVKKRTISQILDNLLNYKLSNAILDNLKIKNNKYWTELSSEEKERLTTDITNFKLEISDTNSFLESQVSSGGVSLNDINPLTMESLVVNNLYIIGELLDINGDCGGYNLTLAWTSGILAGNNIINGGNND
jgi:hypothetical protein